MTLSRSWKTGGYYLDLKKKKKKTLSGSFVPAVRRKSDPDLCECATSDVKMKNKIFSLSFS